MTENGTEGPGSLEDASKPQIEYKYNIQSGKHTKSFGIAYTDFIGIIDASDRKKVIDASKAIDPQHCQMYVVALVAKLESKGLVDLGATRMLKPKIHMSEVAKEFRRLHRVNPPCLEWTQEEDDAFYAYARNDASHRSYPCMPPSCGVDPLSQRHRQTRLNL